MNTTLLSASVVIMELASTHLPSGKEIVYVCVSPRLLHPDPMVYVPDLATLLMVIEFTVHANPALNLRPVNMWSKLRGTFLLNFASAFTSTSVTAATISFCNAMSSGTVYVMVGSV